MSASVYNGQCVHEEYTTYQKNTKSENLPAEPQIKETFLALVEARDRQTTVEQSRTAVTECFEVSQSQVRTIEREGLDKGWPPL